ncbi:hypothetical protein J6590_099851, partial [Homalodisca vitripennis]
MDVKQAKEFRSVHVHIKNNRLHLKVTADLELLNPAIESSQGSKFLLDVKSLSTIKDNPRSFVGLQQDRSGGVSSQYYLTGSTSQDFNIQKR